MMKQEKEYFAFISYKSEDMEWATWLQHELEHYHLPASFNGRTDVPQELRPVFRDIYELSAGNLPEQIKQALESYQRLSDANPQAYEPYLANTLQNMGVSCTLQEKYDDAIQYITEAQEIFQRLAKDNPNVYNRDIEKAEKLINLIHLAQEQSQEQP